MNRSPTFNAVCEVETPLSTIDDLCSALMLIAERMSDEESIVVMRLALLAQDRCKAVEAIRCKLFRLSHPNPDVFGKDGWPGDETEETLQEAA